MGTHEKASANDHLSMQGVRDYETELRANMEAMEAERSREKQQHLRRAQQDRDSIEELIAKLEAAKKDR